MSFCAGRWLAGRIHGGDPAAGLVREAWAVSEKTPTGTIDNVEHIVIFTQQNRSFDHYFGKLRGVRGFNDRMAIRLPNGDPVWKQPASTNYIVPFHMSTATTSATCAKAPSMSYLTDIAMWNKGLCDAWNTARQPGLGMSYFSGDDLHYYYALADAFTICDQYYALTFTQTNPNRLHLFSSSGLSAGFDPALDNAEPTQGSSGKPSPERSRPLESGGAFISNPTILTTTRLRFFITSRLPRRRARFTRRGWPRSTTSHRPSLRISPQARYRRCRGSSYPRRCPSTRTIIRKPAGT